MSTTLFNRIKTIVFTYEGQGTDGAKKGIDELTRLLIEEDLNDKPLVNEKCGTNPIRKSSTGAIRSKLLAEGFRFDLLDSNDSAMRRLAAVFALGFKKYGPDNWKKGFPNSEYYAHHREHMLAYSSGQMTDEDDIAHACWNLMAIMWNEEHLPEMCDFPVTGKTISKLANQQKD